LWSVFKENKTEMTLTCTINNAMVVFRGLEDVERLKSISYSGGSGILERIIFEESSEGGFQSFSQLNIRLRGKSKNYFQITLLLNPVSATNWVKTTFFDRNDFDAFIHKSTYKDNPYLDEDYVKVLESFRDIDENFYNIYCLGNWGVTTGLVFNHWESRTFPFDRNLIDESEILAGCDWGYNHPTALMLSYISDNILYTFDECVAYEITNSEFIQIVGEQEFISKSQKVVYDPEDPARAEEFKRFGYSFFPARKGKGSVRRTIDYIKSFDKWVIDPKCVRLLQEVEQYHWRIDKDGKPMDEPVPLVDDAISAVRYSIEHLAFMHGKPSVLAGRISENKKEIIDRKQKERRAMREVLKAQRREKREARREAKENKS
jgi:phage terminase large subunit